MFQNETLKPLPRRFYHRGAVEIARDLLGQRLVSETDEGLVCGLIVEVEAYLHQQDSACHGARGQTRSNQVMFGPPGRAYVYPIHSRYCFNVVTQPEGEPAAVLVRAVQPEHGLDLMGRRRAMTKTLDLARGPARLCEAFEVDRRLDGWDLSLGERLWIARSRPVDRRKLKVGVSPRIGVTSAKELPLRFFVDGSRFVSGPRRYHSRTDEA